MGFYTKKILYHEQKYSDWYNGTGYGAPIEKVKEALEKHGYKVTVEGEIANVEKNQVIIRCGVMHIEKMIKKECEKFDLKISESGEVYRDGTYVYIPKNIEKELGEILNRLGILEHKWHAEYVPVYEYISGGGIC